MENLENLQLVPSTQWIENLALEELNMEMSGVVHFHEHLDPTFFLDESSVRFVDSLRDRFEYYVAKFNEFRGGQSGSLIRIFKISNTINDFMLFRNSLRLIIARKTQDLITIGFLSGSGDVVSTRLPGDNSNTPFSIAPHEIKAHVGPFNTISWRFQGEVVDIDSLVKFYLTEFLRNSAR